MTFLENKKRLQQRSKASWRSPGGSSMKPWKERLYGQRVRPGWQPPPVHGQEAKKLELDAVTTAVLRHSLTQLLLLENSTVGDTTNISINNISSSSSSSHCFTVQRMANALVGDVYVLDVYADQQQPQEQILPSSGDKRFSILQHRYLQLRRAAVRHSTNRSRRLDPAVQRKYDFLYQLQLLQNGAERNNVIHSWKDARNALETVFDFVDAAASDNGKDTQNPERDENLPRTSTTSRTKQSSKKSSKKHDDDAILQDFQKRLKDIQLDESVSSRSKIGLPPSQHAWQEIFAQSSIFQQAQQQQQEELLLQQKEAEQKKKLQQEALAQQQREAEAQALAAQFLRPLSPADVERLAEAMDDDLHPEQVVAQYEQDTCLRRSLQTLQPGTWLNDEVIHYYLGMLTVRDQKLCTLHSQRRRSHFFKSFFMTKLCNDYDAHNPGVYSYQNVKRWSKKVPGKDIFELDKIFFPINQNNQHWVCAVAYMQERRIQFYDSMGGRGQSYLDNILRYLQDEHLDKKKCPLPDADEWKLVPCTSDTPRQSNCFDCGVFTCMFCDFLAQDCPLVFGQEHVTQCRQRMALSILNGEAMMLEYEKE